MAGRILTPLEYRRIESLSDRFRPIAESLIIEVDGRCKQEDCEILVVYGRRSMDEQLELYSRRRRLKPGADPRRTESWEIETQCEVCNSVVDRACPVHVDARLVGPITWALPGYSAHNYGEAFDLALVRGKGIHRAWIANTDPRWDFIGEAARKRDLEWGGKWKGRRRDCAHVELPQWTELRDAWLEGVA